MWAGWGGALFRAKDRPLRGACPRSPSPQPCQSRRRVGVVRPSTLELEGGARDLAPRARGGAGGGGGRRRRRNAARRAPARGERALRAWCRQSALGRRQSASAPRQWRAPRAHDQCCLRSCCCCRCCSERVSVVCASAESTPAGARGAGAGVVVSGGGDRVGGVPAPVPREVSGPTLLAGAGRPSVRAWGTGGGSPGCQEGAGFHTWSSDLTCRLSASHDQSTQASLRSSFPLFPRLKCVCTVTEQPAARPLPPQHL